jgi:hypothetical protein
MTGSFWYLQCFGYLLTVWAACHIAAASCQALCWAVCLAVWWAVCHTVAAMCQALCHTAADTCQARGSMQVWRRVLWKRAGPQPAARWRPLYGRPGFALLDVDWMARNVRARIVRSDGLGTASVADSRMPASLDFTIDLQLCMDG